ncbi:MAG: hypothetical protein NTV34_00825, partial [Proteobacteria bacterium]|nr:hypothetical protein [Pseudomonadota bacterium]
GCGIPEIVPSFSDRGKSEFTRLERHFERKPESQSGQSRLSFPDSGSCPTPASKLPSGVG